MSPKQVENARKFIRALRTLAHGAYRFIFVAHFDGSIEEVLRTLEQALTLASEKPRPYWQPTDTPVVPRPRPRPAEPQGPWRPIKPWKPKWGARS